MNARRARLALALVVGAGSAGCGARAPGPPPPPPTLDPAPASARPLAPLHGTLPPVPARASHGRSIDIVYPPRGASVPTDSTFVFGSVSLRDPTLTIDGATVPVEPNGAFLAYLPVPESGLYRIEAGSAGGDPPISLEWPVNGAGTAEDGEAAARRGEAAEERPLVTAITPVSYTLVQRGEPMTFTARAPSGLELAIALPDGHRVPMREAAAPVGSAGFAQATAGRSIVRYEATVPVRTSFVAGAGPDAPGTPLPAAAPPWMYGGVGAPPPGVDSSTGEAFLEAVVNGDVLATPLPALGVIEPGYAYVADVRTERPDSAAIGRATLPPGTPLHWFLPNGTRVRVTGLRDGLARVRLTSDLSIWVASDDLAPRSARDAAATPRAPTRAGRRDDAPAPLPAPGQAVGDAYSVRVAPDGGWVEIRVALSERLPFRVDARDGGLDVTVYGARTRTNWAYQGPADPDVLRVWWEQRDDERYVVRVETPGPPWGWDSRWEDAATLVLRVRRPPPLDADAPLRGLYVGVDAGHGDDTGAIGPTGLREGDANRRISRRLADLLRQRGARVLEIRPGPDDLDLAARPVMALDSGVHVLVSVHNNAFPDGVNPFESAGTSVLYNTWQSLDLARALQRELVAELGLRDLGPIWGDLALARPTWMPAVLTEAMFLMVPVQEAALRDADVHDRVAAAHVRGLEAFLRSRLVRQ